MKAPVRMRALRLSALLAIFCWAGGSSEVALQANETGKPLPSAPAGTPLSGLLNVVLQGPFVIEKTSSGINVLIPRVPNHTPPLLVGASPLSSRPLDTGEYSIGISDPGAGPANIVNPVAGTNILKVAGKSENLSSDPQKLRYLRLALPLPLEVVPWNSDPMWLANVTPIPPNTDPVRLAVMVVLRYQYSASTSITLDGKQDDGTAIHDSLTSLASGTEHFIFLVQGMITDDVSDHPTAIASFDKMKQLETSLSRFVSFPDLGTANPGRNQPLLPKVEPQDLTDFLLSNASVIAPLAASNGKQRLKSTAEVHILIGHSDCRAPIIYVDYTQ